MKELGWEAVRFVAGITATVIATRIVWHFLNPFRKDEEKVSTRSGYRCSDPLTITGTICRQKRTGSTS